MAKILGLELSFAEIRYVYIRKTYLGFSLLKKGRISTGNFSPLIKGPENLASIIKELLIREKLSPSRVCLTLSNDDFIIHQITPPKMTEAELNEVIEGEIEGIPKFANLEFDYIYTSSKLGVEKLRILFCALARTTLNSYIQAIEKTGLRLESLEVAPLNSLSLLYARAPKDKAQALVVLDEHTSSITIFTKDDCKLFFQMATGLEDLYTKGSLDKSAFLSWTEEMKRIIRSYHQEFSSQAIEKVWLIWDNENLKELDTLVGEELEIWTIPPKPPDFGFAKKDELNPIFFLSLASPLAFLKGIKQKFDFRHFLSSMVFSQVLKKVIVLATAYIAAVVFISGLILSGFILSKNKLDKQAKELLQRVAVLEEQTTSLRKEKDDYLQVKDRLLKQAAFVRMLNRVSWSKIFATISVVLPQEVSLSWFDVSESGQIRLEGSAFTIDSIADVIRKLNSVVFLENAQFNFLKEQEVEKKKFVDFGIVTRLKSQ